MISKLTQYFIAACLVASPIISATASAAYTRNPHVSEKVWNQVAPYFIPEDHPIKAKLDLVFSSSRVILDLKSLEHAGFIDPEPREFTRLIVTRHPEFPGYIFKIYVDAQRYHKMKEWECWISRINGVRLIQEIIDARGLQAIFKTPDKWIYPLPAAPSPSSDFIRKNFILVEEDMDLYGQETNEELWGSAAITQDLLDEFFNILETVGLHDCAKPHNAPFSKDGRIAFIDTQSYHEWPVNLKALTPYLSPSNKTYWKALIKGARKRAVSNPAIEKN